jgi:hypothetical protein
MSNSTTSQPKSTWLSVLLVIVLISAVLVVVVASAYSYSLSTAIEAVVGVIILLAATSFLWFYRRQVNQHGIAPANNRDLVIGIVLGLLWVIEIGINNFIAPPLPLRDIIDNIFWGVIAFSIMLLALRRAYQANNLVQGIRAGLWSGFASGALACSMALGMIVFGMGYITHDPLNIQEWSVGGSSSAAPTMAAYFAYETLAGAFGHLVVLGIAMGGVLGVIGGIFGKGTRAVIHLVANLQRQKPA